MAEQNQQNRMRNRFVLWFFLVGAILPVIFTTIGILASPDADWNPNAPTPLYRLMLAWILWPTWIFMMDAEHAPEIVISLLFSCPINGAIYAIVGLLFWDTRKWLRKLKAPG